MNIVYSIRKRLKNSFESIKNQQLKQNLLQALPFWVASLLTGLVAVLYSKLFAGAEHISGYLLLHCKWWLLLISPTLFLAAYLIVVKFAPYSRGSGIPQVIAALELSTPKEYHKVRKLLSIKVIVVKICSSLLVAIGGGVIGREGPTIQIAGSIFRKVNQWIPDTWPKISRKNMIMTGAAAGLAAAFNTPLGGIVFAVEELTRTHIRYFRTAIFTSVIIAGLTAQYFLGPYLYLGYPDVSNLHGYVFFGVIFTAAMTGIIGSIMCKAILYVMNWKRKFTLFQNMLFVAVCAFIIILIALVINTQMLGSGKELMNTMLFTQNKRIEWYLPFLRTLGPVLSFSTGVAGGVFAPALSAGAAFGSLVAGWANLSPTDTNIIILSGMVGFLTGVTRTPFTSAILVLEMTDRHNVIFHLMLAGMVAGIVSIIVDKKSFYDHLKEQYLHTLKLEEAENRSEGGEGANALP
jgi:H+/Cl- antiporter ClcA